MDSVKAEFSLMDFLRDNYDMTKLVLRGLVIDFSIDESRRFGSGISVSGAGGGVALAQVSIVDNTIRPMDRQVGQSFVAADVDGELQLSSFARPFQFQGSGVYHDE